MRLSRIKNQTTIKQLSNNLSNKKIKTFNLFLRKHFFLRKAIEKRQNCYKIFLSKLILSKHQIKKIKKRRCNNEKEE